jgi:ribosomal protein S8E
MKIMNVNLTIDVKNPQQVQALKQLMDALAGETPASSPMLAGKPAEVAEDESEKEARRKRAEARKARKAEPDPEPEEQEEEEEQEGEEADILGEEEVIDIATLRTLTATKSTQFRAEIKAQLAKYGVANVTSIPENKYTDYLNFLNSL